ncbi:hypothetical protein Acr_14g0006180 [Actinidia rufa]|uniref:Uncharacterized protein n=1 Tax=Actinidia rufa TaxID=165716 RepID=A0A7J0FQI1_9ERIC|nr:hypothetical protein Acr_14g0006180 [Actinidia rufa]
MVEGNVGFVGSVARRGRCSREGGREGSDGWSGGEWYVGGEWKEQIERVAVGGERWGKKDTRSVVVGGTGLWLWWDEEAREGKRRRRGYGRGGEMEGKERRYQVSDGAGLSFSNA